MQHCLKLFECFLEIFSYTFDSRMSGVVRQKRFHPKQIILNADYVLKLLIELFSVQIAEVGGGEGGGVIISTHVIEDRTKLLPADLLEKTSELFSGEIKI